MFFVLGVLIFVPLFIVAASLRVLIMTPQNNNCGFDLWNLLFYVSSNLITAAAVKYFYNPGHTSKDIIDITKVEDEIRYWVNLRQQLSSLNPNSPKPWTTKSTEKVESTEEKAEPPTEEKTERGQSSIEEIRKDVETLTMGQEQISTEQISTENTNESPKVRRRSRKED